MRPIADAWKSGDRELAQRLAHTLKGVAGTIGAVDVQAAAQAVERRNQRTSTD